MLTILPAMVFAGTETEKMSKLPEKIKKKLKAEAFAWDASIAKEKPEEPRGCYKNNFGLG